MSPAHRNMSQADSYYAMPFMRLGIHGQRPPQNQVWNVQGNENVVEI